MSVDTVHDISEFFHTELFPSLSSPPQNSVSSRSSSPTSLPTPPNVGLMTGSLPDISDPSSVFGNTSLFNFLEEDMKGLNDPFAGSASSAFDFFGWNFDNNTTASSSSSPMGIDPQLVGSPEEPREQVSPQDNVVEDANTAKLTLTINPVKVGGHGKARKGTVHSGGVTKPKAIPTQTQIQSTTVIAPPKDKENKKSKDDDDDDDLPEDWRPSPEVLAKMTSKEKRQLRNKISARNFRVRRKEYISTLEMDIAERDRLLQAIRTELGSTQSENVALRQEIAALKKALLEGRTGTLTSEDVPILNLPPPAPLPPISAAATTATAPAIPTSSSLGLVTPNTHKDIPTSPRLGGNAFWGGLSGFGGLGGGVTPVHTVLVPELSALARNVNRPANGALQENINPVLNYPSTNSISPNLNSSPTLGALGLGFGKPSAGNGFEGFTDTNPFTLKSLDAYRMQLWSKMASQHPPPSSPPSFSSGSSSSSSPPSSAGARTPPPLISSPSMFTQSLPPQSPPSYPSYSWSPPLGGLAGSLKPQFFANTTNIPRNAGKASGSTSPKTTSQTPALVGQKERDQALIAALASQTLFKKLGGAFWDAFSGSSSSSPSVSASGSSTAKAIDADKVRKVLEGKAVVRVVDIDSSPSPACGASECATRMLEESMRSLTLGRK